MIQPADQLVKRIKRGIAALLVGVVKQAMHTGNLDPEVKKG